MRQMGLCGLTRGKAFKVTTVAEENAHRPADLVLDALEQAIHARSATAGLIRHGDRGVQYLSIRYSERLAECGIEASVGTTGDVPPAEFELAYHRQRATQAMAA